jgi:dipeptidyl aminopeptidase/acylaminoacyl peptidase
LLISHTTLAKEGEAQGLVPEDYFDFVFVADPQVSPDGARILFVKSTVNEDASGRDRHIYMIEDDQVPRRFTQGDGDSSPRWSPDGKTIAFIRSVDKIAQVFLMPANGGEASQATESEESVSSFQWFSDSKRLMLTMATSPEGITKDKEESDKPKRAEPDIVVVKDAKYIANGAGFLDDKRRHLYVFDIHEKSLAQLTFGADYNINSPQLSADGAYIVYAANKTGLEYDGSPNQDIFRFNIATKESAPLTVHPHVQTQPRLSSNNKTIAYVHTEAAFEQSDLWVMDNEGNNAKNLTQDFDRFVSPPFWGAQDKILYFLASDRGAVRLFAADPNSAKVTQVIADNKTVGNLSLSPNGDFALFTKEDSTHLPELFRFDFANQQLTKLTHFNDELLATAALSPAEEVWFKNEKGMDVQGFIHKPINYAQGKQYPLVLNIKGGPGGMWGHQWFHENQMYAAKGYAVAYVNYRGSNGYGIAHSQAVRLDYGGADYEDNIQFLDTVLSQNAWIDDEQLFITGGSHGGFLTNWITTKTDRFKAAVTQRSVSSWISEAGTQEFTPRQMTSEFGGNLWTNFDYYWDRSPLQFADKVSTPTLIIHSDGDMITPIGQGQEWFYALKANKVPTEMVIFKGENHSLSRTGTPTNLVERLDRILEWFERYSEKGDN